MRPAKPPKTAPWAEQKAWLRAYGSDDQIKTTLLQRGLPKEDMIGSCDRCSYRAVGLCATCPKWKTLLPAFRRSGRITT